MYMYMCILGTKPKGECFIPDMYLPVLSSLYHHFLATLYLLALIQVPASSALHAIRSQAGL